MHFWALVNSIHAIEQPPPRLTKEYMEQTSSVLMKERHIRNGESLDRITENTGLVWMGSQLIVQHQQTAVRILNQAVLKTTQMQMASECRFGLFFLQQ
mmetsp:Transcript_5398/g.13926  ORF Transcript_5398/g.13926 Transcript_5398/m.13926 type:complete len:98 (-) Transcript_5398:1057-1350(-)